MYMFFRVIGEAYTSISKFWLGLLVSWHHLSMSCLQSFIFMRSRFISFYLHEFDALDLCELMLWDIVNCCFGYCELLLWIL
ncbi:hypothetical protein Syun_031620 [Stephania yunnanensis]|uniref:Uncharacterized protein n=1 Tax=Stephania yunnanensis TaxID=152371 RepID=A0AAP0HF27_9MAGN